MEASFVGRDSRRRRLGHRARRASGARRARRAAVGARSRRSWPTCARGAPTPCTCRTSRFPTGLRVTADLERGAARTPSSSSRRCRRTARASIAQARGAATSDPGAIVVSATKGLEQDTLFRMSEIIAQELGDRRARRRALRARASRRSWRASCRRRSRSRRAMPAVVEQRAGGVPRAVLPALRHRRCRRRRDRRRAEERHRDRGGRGRRAWASGTTRWPA